MTTPPDDLVGSARERYRRTDQVGDPRHRRHRGERVPAGAERDGRGRRADRGQPDDIERGRVWAEEQGVTRAVEGYDAVIADPEVEAVYIPLPNGLHAEWTIAALEAGKAVFCEKPLCGTAEETERVLAAARATGGPLWEAFVFPFHEQMDAGARAARRRHDRPGARDPVAVPLRAGRPGRHPDVREPGGRLDPGRRLLPDPAGAAALRCRAGPRHARSPTPYGPRTVPTRSCGGRWCSPAIDGWSSHAGSAAATTRSRASSAPRARSGMTVPFHPDADDELTIVRDGEFDTQPAPTSGEMSFTPGDPAHPPRDPRAGGAASPRRGRSDGQRARDRRAARFRSLARLNRSNDAYA